MKIIKLVVLAWLLTGIAYAQDCGYESASSLSSVIPIPGLQAGPCLSNNGYCHTPKGNLHIMWVYVVFNNELPDADHSWWPVNGIPDFAALNGAPNDLLDIDPNIHSNRPNLTTWYRRMSDENFTVTGEVFKVSIDKIYSNPPLNTVLDYEGMEATAFAALQLQLQNRDLSAFDQRQNMEKDGYYWSFDNSRYKSNGDPAGGDGIIDYITLNFRVPLNQFIAGGASPGMFSGNSLITTVGSITKTYTGSVGHRIDYKMDEPTNRQYFTHEFAHNLYHSPHYMGANGMTGYHFYGNKGWGMMSYLATIHTSNAWEKWLLGWIDMSGKTITTNQTGIVLKDFVTENDALRIAIPGTDQYVWLENHQRKDSLDDRVIPGPAMGKGIYAFISGQPCNCDDRTTFEFGMPATNMFKILSAKGNHDYTNLAVQDFVKTGENPVSGQTDVTYIRYNPDGSNTIEYCNTNPNSHAYGTPCPDEQGEVIKENGVYTSAFYGTEDEPFHMGDEISINGVVPALNYPTYNNGTNQVNDFNLNGLSIKIVAYNPSSGEYMIDVSYDENELTENKRWSSFVSLPDVTQNSNPDLVIKSNKTLTINKSGTVNTITKGMGDIEFPDFIKPTVFTCKQNAYVQMEDYSTIVVEQNSTFKMEPHSKLQVGSGAMLVVQSGSKLDVGTDARIEVLPGGMIMLQDASLVYNPDASITLHENSFISLNDHGKIEVAPDATFSWTGDGFLKVNTSTRFVSNVVASGPNARFEQHGTVNPLTNKFDKKIIEIVGAGTLSFDKSLSGVELKDGVILMGQDAIVDVDPYLWCSGVKFTSDNPNIKHGGLWVYGQQTNDDAYANNCTFEYATTGITVYPAQGISSKAKLFNCVFRNCNEGINVYGKGAEIYNSTFWQISHQAIHLSGIQNTCIISNSKVYESNNGMLALGSSNNLVHVKERSKLYENHRGVFASNAQLGVGCSQVKDNTGVNIEAGYLSQLIMEPALLPLTGNNRVSSQYSAPVYFDGANALFINNGNSDFHTWNMSTMPMSGTLMPLIGLASIPVATHHIFYAANNYWHASGPPAPVQFTDYDMPWLDGYGTQVKLLDGGSSLSSAPLFPNCIVPPGGLPGTIFPGQGSVFLGKAPRLCNGSDAETVFTTATNTLYPASGIPNFTGAFNDFESLVLCGYNLFPAYTDADGNWVSEFELWYNVIDLSYTRMVECFTEGIASGQIDRNNTVLVDSYITRIIAAQDHLLVMAAGKHELKFRLYVDRAMMYRLKQDYTAALQVLNEVSTWSNHADETVLVDFYTCFTGKEQLAVENILTKADYRNATQECYALLGVSQAPLDPPSLPGPPDAPDVVPDEENEGPPVIIGKRSGLGQAGDPLKTVSVYPNPAQNRVYIKTPVKYAKATIEILDVLGKKVFTQGTGEYQDVIALNLDLSTGTYFVQLFLDDEAMNRTKLVVVK